jgi:vacuolar-type H+-ATPase subunit E/Vma4
MSKEITGSSHFLERITGEADLQAQRMLEEARQAAEIQAEKTEKQIEELQAEQERRKLQEQERADRKLHQNVNVAFRKEELKLQEEMNRSLLDQARQDVMALRDSDGYLPVLKQWILEALIGLSVSSVELEGGSRERQLLTPSVLKELEGNAKSRWNLKVTLSLSENQALRDAGIIAREKGGRLVFNNLLETRMLRKRSDLRQQIYQSLFEEEI